ncbi:MAG: hypothetical protein ABL871_06675 [Terricaulis sp.]
MRGRWSFGVVVAIVVAVCVATASHSQPPARHAHRSAEVTLALHSDGVQLRIPRAHLTVTFGL